MIPTRRYVLRRLAALSLFAASSSARSQPQRRKPAPLSPRAALEGRWQTTMRFWNGPQLLIVDELGYLPMPGEAASHLFQVITRRYEHGSIILTTNRGIASWGEIFEDSTVAAAILDRLLHHATVLQIDGDSYRMRTHRARLATLRAGLNAPDQGGEFPRSHLGKYHDR